MEYHVENEIFGHLEGIIDSVDRMTSGNFMHNRASIKLSAKIIIDRLHSMGIYEKNEDWYMDIEKHNCEICGSSKARYIDDPYDLEIYNKRNKRWLCSKCAHELWLDT